jgi:transcriptional regulator with XRE-family HTH domain
MASKFIHYLRNERRATGLTQADIAALLGASWKSKISRYERRAAVPPLETALGYEAVFGKPLARLFGPTSDRVAQDVRQRARDLLARSETPRTLLQARRIRSLERIVQ